MTLPRLSELLTELRVAPEYHELLSRLLGCAGSRAADLAQEFAVRLLEAREANLPEAEAVALSACRRWLKRARISDSVLTPLALPDAEGKERERELRPLPMPAPQVRRQLRWGRRNEAISIPVPAPHADLAAAVQRLPMPERRAIQACFGVGGPKRRGRRSAQLLALAERAVERLRQTLPQEHFAVNLF